MVAWGEASCPEAWAGLATILREAGGLRQGEAVAPMAERTGLPGPLTEHVRNEWAVARSGLWRARQVERVLATYEIPIEGRDEWVAATGRLARGDCALRARMASLR